MIKSLFFAGFCFAICYVLFVALRRDDMAAFKGIKDDGKFKPSGRGDVVAGMVRLPGEKPKNLRDADG